VRSSVAGQGCLVTKPQRHVRARLKALRDLPAVLFAIYAAAALPLILFRFGRNQWFFGDEWSFLAERNGANFGDLFLSHAEHWSTIPVISYRLLFNAFALHTYLPYQAVVVVAHLVTASLLLVVMRRAEVHPWTATFVASTFVLFGPGQENIVWAFQIGFVGAVVFGLIHLILADHEGPVTRRDWLGLLAGVASLMCSGVSLVMVVVVGIATFVRRGWKPAGFHTLPLVALYGFWFAITNPSGIPNPYGRRATITELARFVWSGVRGTVVAIGGDWQIGIIVGIVFIVGLPLAFQSLSRLEIGPRIAPLALLAGALVFLVGTGATRWFVTPVADTQSRYIYTVAALMLPALGVAIDVIINRWRLVAPAVLALFVISVVMNVGQFGTGFWSKSSQRAQKQLVLALAFSPEAQTAPAYLRPSAWYSIGWLRDVAADGKLPHPARISSAFARQVSLILAIAQRTGRIQPACRTLQSDATLLPDAGEFIAFRFVRPPRVGTSYFEQNSIVVSQLGPHGSVIATLGMKSDYGQILEIERDGLRLRIRAGDMSQGLVLCSNP